MKYLINIIKSLKEIIITYILQYIVIIISCIIYLLLGKNNPQDFISNYCPYILIIYYLIIIIYLYIKNKRKEQKLPKYKYYYFITIGISISCIFNMIIFLLTTQSVTQSINFILLLITSGIIGPIYEELLFRYILLNKLKKFNSTKKAILISTIIFALIHITPIKICYAFILGLILNITYHKEKNILAPIIIHISANIISLFLTEFNSLILIFSIITILIIIKLNTKQKN